MRLLDLLHRWGGGILGLILAVLGLSGAILVHKEDWITLPHAGDPRVGDPVALGHLTARLLAEPAVQSVIYASDRFGLVQARAGEGGFYASQTGEIVAHWGSQWERPELWLFDLHHHLFAGEMGEAVAGIAGLAAVLFVVTGAILWWRTRRTFRLRLWPARMTGPAIRWQHRDLGIVAAPLLLLVALTGAMMIFRPVAGFVLAPLSSPEVIAAEMKAPKLASGPLSAKLDWRAIVAQAHRAFPDAQLRLLALPRKPGDPVTVRMKRAGEWLPNGRTMLWFDAATGRLLARRDALAMQPGTQAFNMLYPLHAAKVGGLAYRLAMTFAGLAMALLGTLAVSSFWFRGGRRLSARA
jgi:uncharacterized iron-regulated membrane protein